MAATTGRIDHDRMDEPHVSGRRISVLQIYEEVEDDTDRPDDVSPDA